MSHLRGDYGSPSLQLDRNFDDITCPPPPSHAKSDAQKLRWKKRHMGLLRRAQTLPSNARISAMFGVSVAVAVVPWAFIRRLLACPGPAASQLCRYAWSVVFMTRAIGLFLLAVSVFILIRKWYWLHRLSVELAHVSPAQRRLLGLPASIKRPSSTASGSAGNGRRGDGDIDGAGDGAIATPSADDGVVNPHAVTNTGSLVGKRPWSGIGSRSHAELRLRGKQRSTGSGAGTPNSRGASATNSPQRTPLRYASLGSSRGSFDTPSRPGRLRARQLGLEGTTAINSEEDLAEYLRRKDARSQMMGTDTGVSSPGRGGGGSMGASMTGSGYGMAVYDSGVAGSFAADGQFYEYQPGYSYDAQSRKSSIAGVGLDNMQEAEELLSQLNMTKQEMHAFTENLRKFIAQYLQQKFKTLDWNVGQLVKKGFNADFLMYRTTLGSNPLNPLEGKMRLDEMIHRLSQETGRYLVRTPDGNQVQLWKQRTELNAFFELRRGGDKGYIMHRLRLLCSDGYLGHFQWDGGGKWNGQKWSPERPSDALLLLHVFMTMMDRRLRAHLPTELQPFQNRYCHDGPKMPPKSKLARRHPMLHIVSSQPPHCRVIAGNKPRAIVQGRENVFQAIAVFLFYVKEEENDRLGSVDIRDLTRRVLTVQPGYYDALYFME